MATSLKVLLPFVFFVASVNCIQNDGGAAFRLNLNDGNSIPTLGLGTFLGFDKNGQVTPKDNDVTNAVEWAIDIGYRLIDTAEAYKDEEEIGVAIDNKIKSGAVKREDLFVVTKLGSNQHRNVLPALRGSLKRLGLHYVDLYLIHSPVAFKPDHKEFDVVDYLDTWKQMEEAKTLGLARSIGLSNFNQSQIQRILDNSELKPSVLQVEVNLNLAQDDLVSFCKEKGIVVMAYSPFGSLFAEREGQSAPPPRVDDSALVGMATGYKKTTPQIVLRYLVERGLIPIPKSLHKERIEQNINIFDFQLNTGDKETLAKFNRNFRVVWPSYWQEYPYYPFERKEVPDKSPF